jgi:hypothetical protein
VTRAVRCTTNALFAYEVSIIMPPLCGRQFDVQTCNVMRVRLYLHAAGDLSIKLQHVRRVLT